MANNIIIINKKDITSAAGNTILLTDTRGIDNHSDMEMPVQAQSVRFTLCCMSAQQDVAILNRVCVHVDPSCWHKLMTLQCG